VLGGAIAAAGAVHMVLGIFQFTKRDDCAVHHSAGGCAREYGDTKGISQEKVLMGFGAAGVAAGAVWMGVGPIARIRMRADSRSASLTVQGNF
jgi:hypothetical protein